MERDKLEQKLWDIRISRDKVEILEILAEFDRLTAEVALMKERIKDTDTLYAKANDLQAENEGLKSTPAAYLYANLLEETVRLRDDKRNLQSHLDRISEPMKKWHENKMDVADAIEITNQHIADYLDSQKPSEKQHGPLNTRVCKHGRVVWSCPICNPKTPIECCCDKSLCHHCQDNYLEIHKGGIEDCPICNPAPHIYVDSHGEEWSHSGLEKDCPICRLKPLSGKLP